MLDVLKLRVYVKGEGDLPRVYGQHREQWNDRVSRR